MDDNKRRDDGMAQRRKVLGDEWVDKSIKNRNAFNTDFQDLITRYAWGDIWTRPHFDHRTRRVLVIGTMVALGQWDEFRLHVRAALSEGASRRVKTEARELFVDMLLPAPRLVVVGGVRVGDQDRGCSAHRDLRERHRPGQCDSAGRRSP